MAPKAEETVVKTKVAVKAKVAVKKDDAPKAAVKKAAPKKDDEVKPDGEEKKEEVTEAEVAPEEETPKEPEKPSELEEDAAADSRKKVAASDVEFNLAEATLNVLPSINDKLLMSLTDGGFQYLMAGVKSTAGLKSGRYMFEVKIIESLNPSEPQGTKSPAPKQLVRVGLATAESSVFLSEGLLNVCFDSEGFFSHGRKRAKVGQKFTFGETVAVLVNLDAASPNANTISLFKNGVRASEPQALPEGLKGKTLFPTISYKNVTLRANFGPNPMTPLPFSCRMVKDAAGADVEIVKTPAPKDGKYEVLFPLGMPDEGVFEWADQFLKKNPTYTEISDRKIVEWASKSNIERQQPNKACVDKPDMNFGIPLLDDLSVKKLLKVIAPTLNRNYLVMELKENLTAETRQTAAARFGDFKKVAVVAMGEPSADYVGKVHADMLAEKKKKAEEAQKKKAREEERKKLFEEKKRKAEEARKAKLAARKAEAAAKAGTEDVAEEEEEAKAEEEEAPKEEEKKEEKEEPTPMETDLTEEEKQIKHKKQTIPDLSQATLAKFYAKFSLPASTEGFDEVRYVWSKQPKCAELLGSWVHERKMTQRVEDLQPGEWFKDLWSRWMKSLQDWKKRQAEWKDPAKKKALIAKKKADAKKAKADAKAEAADGEEKKEGEEAEAAVEEEEEEPMEIVADDLDVFAIEDIMDLGNCEPLFANFVYEDWTLLSLRMEFHLMLHAWKKDLNDPERPSFTEAHMPYYYSKYFKKQFVLSNLSVEKMEDFIDWVKDSVTINDTSHQFEAQLEEDLPFENFLKLAEEHRRDRQRRCDAGDETAKLKFIRPAPVAAARPAIQAAGAVGGAPARAGVPGAAGQKRPYPGAAPQPGGYASKQPRIGGYGGQAVPGPQRYGVGPASAPRPMGGMAPYGAYGQQPGAYGAGPPRQAYGMGMPAAGKGYGGGKGGVYGGGYYRAV